jgi:hypothetical protein
MINVVCFFDNSADIELLQVRYRGAHMQVRCDDDWTTCYAARGRSIVLVERPATSEIYLLTTIQFAALLSLAPSIPPDECP